MMVFGTEQSFVRKLKTHYIELTAKDKYVKTILDDDAPIITLEDNLALQKSNEEKKAKLKEAKVKLQKTYDEVGKIVDELDEGEFKIDENSKHKRSFTIFKTDYNKTKELQAETSAVLQDILDKHLQLSRLRAAYPLPRLTVSSAQSKLESQEEEMAQCDATLSKLNAEVEEVKEKLKESAREVERLKVERAKVEEEVRRSREGREEEEEGLAELYEWYVLSTDNISYFMFVFDTRFAQVYSITSIPPFSFLYTRNETYLSQRIRIDLQHRFRRRQRSSSYDNIPNFSSTHAPTRRRAHHYTSP